VAAAFVATPSNAAIVVPCNSTNITVSGAAPTSFDCAGFVDGNALNASDKNTDPTTSELLAELDYFGSLTGIETFTGLDGLSV
ncbi:hypothetical protein, partial [Sphingomonas sp. PB4P5]|uniref:hypothetical protein n=1 Tax=Parasphingomonas puruogangriensis TaxID=3096155 RepID=UPI002FC98177